MLSPFARPLYVMLKPAGPQCNLACDYCYYLEKTALSQERPSQQLMSDALLEQFTRDYIQSQTTPQVLFTWHGGEPLLRPLTFYQRALELQQRYAGGRHIDNVIQTNGTMLNDEWCHFFHDHHWLVGISIDGTQQMHDSYRHTRGGGPTWQRVMQGVELLKRHEVDWNAMATVNACNVEEPEAFYRFFKQTGAQFIQFAPIVERRLSHPDGRQLATPDDTGVPLEPWSVTPRQWGNFLCRLFDEWVREDVGKVFVQLFDATLANWCGVAPGVCTLGADCGHAAVMEAGGDVYSCDHFVFPEYRLGNIHTQTLVEMLYGPRQQAFSRKKRYALPTQCRQCHFLFACHGECPKNRFAHTPNGEPGLNYLCEGYRQFFEHVAPWMDERRELFSSQVF